MSSDSRISGILTSLKSRVTGKGDSDEKTEGESFSGRLKKDWWKYLTLISYCVLLELVISVHSPWHDELQSWLLARDTNPISLLFQYLRYEGHPGLWHLILMPPAKLGLPVEVLNMVSAVLLAAAVYLILFRSPFPTIIKILLPFSYFLFYQYAVIARSYALMPLLLFLIAIIYNKKVEKPIAFYTLLILLANVSLHGTLISLSLLALYLPELKKKWKGLSTKARKKNIAGLAVFALALILLVIILFPPADISSPAEYNFGIAHLLKTSGEALNTSLMTWSHLYFSIPLLLIILVWFYKRRLLLTYLAITIPLLLFFAVILGEGWHFGILFIVLAFVLWLSFDDEHRESERTFDIKKLPVKYIAVAAILVILLVQVRYSFNSSRTEYCLDYSCIRTVADSIKDNNLEGKKIDILGKYTSILAYFDENIFNNFNNGEKPCFWIAKKSNDHIENVNQENILRALEDNPDYIFIPYESMRTDELDVPGYRPVSIYYGLIIWAGKSKDLDSVVLYKRE